MKKQIIRQKRFSRQFSVPANSSVLPIDAMDRVSCFETMRAYRGRVFHAREHLERLSDSCKAIGRPLGIRMEEIEVWLLEALKERRLKNALLRLAVHFGDDSGSGDQFVLSLRKFKSHPPEWYKKGVSLKTTARRRFDFKAQDPQIKASQFMNGVLAILDESGSKILRSSSGGPRAHELLFFGPLGTVAEGTVSNVFIVKDKQLLTPAVSSGILRGVTRAVVMSLAQKRGIKVVETLLTRHELYTADECFMTNTSSEVLPVVSIDGRTIGAGVPGSLTGLLAAEFKRSIR